jgi:V-type H+-transporting ATPase subunit F
MASKKPKFAKGEMKISIISDEDMVSGFVLAGIGHRDGQGNTNFLVVDSKTRRSDIEDKFNELISRTDIGVIIIAQHTADSIRHALNAYTETGQVIPTILEVPTKDHPYDPNTDSVMQRVKMFMGGKVDM